MIPQSDLTTEEKRAIATLKRLAKTWPKTLWLFSGAGTLHVMKCGPSGERMMTKGYRFGEEGPAEGCVDPAYDLASINIPNDGGDW